MSYATSRGTNEQSACVFRTANAYYEYMAFIEWFVVPYEFSAAVLACCLLAAGGYVLGLIKLHARGHHVALWRTLTFLLGIALIYAVLQTHFDYWAQHMFFIHRGQHLILHHLAPFLIVLAAPTHVLGAAVPERLRPGFLVPLAHVAPVRYGWRFIQHPVISGTLFAGLVVLWLVSSVHFYAMLNVPLYDAMNWSMAIDGLLFWALVLDPRSPRTTPALGYGPRIAVLAAVMLPQIAVGAYIALCRVDLYPVYAVCGRLWPLSPVTDQILGGLITWIPAAMMSVAGILVVFRRMLNDDAPERAYGPAAQTGAAETLRFEDLRRPYA